MHHSTSATKQVWDDENVLLSTDADGAIQVVYTREPAVFGNLISQSCSGTDSFHLFDAVGSTRQLTDTSGAVTDNYLFDTFGNTLAVSVTHEQLEIPRPRRVSLRRGLRRLFRSFRRLCAHGRALAGAL